jgi:RNA recognition motif-containing protein
MDNELISTACSPKTPREQHANNSNKPIQSICSHSLSEELFTAFSSKFPAGEELYVFRNQKNTPKNKKPPKQAAFAVAQKITLKTFVKRRPFSPWLLLSCA